MVITSLHNVILFVKAKVYKLYIGFCSGHQNNKILHTKIKQVKNNWKGIHKRNVVIKTTIFVNPLQATSLLVRRNKNMWHCEKDKVKESNDKPNASFISNQF